VFRKGLSEIKYSPAVRQKIVQDQQGKKHKKGISQAIYQKCTVGESIRKAAIRVRQTRSGEPARLMEIKTKAAPNRAAQMSVEAKIDPVRMRSSP